METNKCLLKEIVWYKKANLVKKSKFQQMKWPAKIPNINPIENLWATLNRKLGGLEQ